MWVNPMRAGVERGEVQLGTWVTMVRTPGILPLLKAAGLDFVRIDMEHGGFSIETVADMAVVAQAVGIALVVRPPVANREWITTLLDVGVFNLHCPQVDTVEHAAEIVAASRYAPMGSRGMGGRGGGTNFGPAGSAEARAHANRTVFVTVMLESARALGNLDAIAAMDGIDVLTLGPHDLAQDLGVLDAPDHDRIIDDKRKAVIAAAAKNRKNTAMLVSSTAQGKKLKEAGVRILAYSNEVEVIHGAYSAAMAEMRGGTR
jgi:2-dehydro-3-deoxyglucarate aldolase/4-hydroxy-2-oxoheptanedioate aldolase